MSSYLVFLCVSRVEFVSVCIHVFLSVYTYLLYVSSYCGTLVLLSVFVIVHIVASLPH